VRTVWDAEAIDTSHLGFRPIQKIATIHASSGFIRGIPNASAKLDLRETTDKRGTMTNLQMVRGEASCPCCSGLLGGKFDRRHFVRAVAIGGATLAIAPYLALAAEGNYEAMVLSCIDPRMQEPVHKYTVEQNLTGKFSQFVIAGAAIGVVAPAFKDW